MSQLNPMITIVVIMFCVLLVLGLAVVVKPEAGAALAAVLAAFAGVVRAVMRK